MKTKQIKIQLYLLILFLTVCFSACTNIDGLILQGRLQEAEEYCKTQDEGNRVICYSKLAESYLQNKNYDKAADLYIEAGETDIEVYNNIANDAFLNKTYKKATEYYKKAGNSDGQKNVADIYLSNKDYEKAVELYIEAGENEQTVYSKVANDAFSNKKYKTALLLYKKLGYINKIKECEELLKTIKIITGKWEGKGVSLIVSEDGLNILSLKLNVYDLLNGYIDCIFNNSIPIVKEDYDYSFFYGGKASAPPIPITIKGHFSEDLNSVDIIATTFISSYVHKTGKSFLTEYPTTLTAEPK